MSEGLVLRGVAPQPTSKQTNTFGPQREEQDTRDAGSHSRNCADWQPSESSRGQVHKWRLAAAAAH